DVVVTLVPDGHLAASVLALRYLPLERGVLEGMVLGVHCEMVLIRDSGRPLGRAQETRTPSRSSRRSQCRLRAWCSWITNLCRPVRAAGRRPIGSGVLREF